MGKKRIRREKKAFQPKMVDHLAMITIMHFPHATSFDDLHCVDCEDVKAGVCEGNGLRGLDVLDCMSRKVMSGE